jgi:hypothetical protein
MQRKFNMQKYHLIFIVLVLVFGGLSPLSADETKWLSVSMLHNWFSSGGCEIEVGRRHEVRDQQDGFQYPALYSDQDMQAAKGLWIGAKNFNDPVAGKTYGYKVVHCGPRILDEESEFIPQEFKMYGKFDHPGVYVNGNPGSQTYYRDADVTVTDTLKADRMLYNVVNTSIGVTITRKIYAFTQQYHNNYFIYDFVFKNTGIYDKNGNVFSQTLEDVIFFFQYRWAVCKYMGAYGKYYAPQDATWGVNTVNEVLHPSYGDDIRASYAYHGLHSGFAGNNIGAPYTGTGGTGFLGASQFPGVVTIWADKSATEKVDDTQQPKHAPPIYSDADVTQPSFNDQYSEPNMRKEYTVYMNSGLPSLTHADMVGDGNANELPLAGAGGVSQGIGYGPYTLEPGQSIHIVMAECVGSISWDKRVTIGEKWLNEIKPYILPNGSETNNRDEYKNAWVFTGVDSLLQTFNRAIETYNNDFVIDPSPPPPDIFEVNSGGDRITLEWSNSAESYEHFGGYRVYRSVDTPDTTFEMIFECGQGTDNPLTNRYEDRNAIRGFDYYYYVVTVDDGTVKQGIPMESSLFWTRTIEPANLTRQPGSALKDIRIVPNPYYIGAVDYQFGAANPDRLMFYGLPPQCLIKIFTERGDLIKTIRHTDFSGDESWDSLTSSGQVIVSGVYIAYFEVTEDAYDNNNNLLFRKGDNIVKKFITIR